MKETNNKKLKKPTKEKTFTWSIAKMTVTKINNMLEKHIYDKDSYPQYTLLQIKTNEEKTQLKNGERRVSYTYTHKLTEMPNKCMKRYSAVLVTN